MPISVVTGPDGAKYKVTHPEGASDEEILSQVSAYSAPQEAAVPTAEQQRQDIAGGSLSFGLPGLTPVFDTGIQTPQWLDEGLAGMGRRFSEIGTLGTHETPEEAKTLLNDSGYAMAGGALADLSTLAAGGSLLRGGGMASKLLTSPQTASQAVLGGALYGGATSNDRASGAIGGGLGGGLGYGIPKLVGKAVSPHVDDAARAMIDDGMTLTPGEILGGGVKRAEDALTSVPIVGDAIRTGQLNTLKQYNKGVINEALDAVGKSLPDSANAGREAIDAANGIMDDVYDDVLSNMNVTMDGQFMSELGSLRSMVDQLPEATAKRFSKIVNETIFEPFDNPNKLLLGRTFKEAASKLRYEYQRHQKSPDPVTQDLGDALRTAHMHLMDIARRQNPEMGAKLTKADQAYAMLSRVNEAANYAGAREGVFTPSHLLNAVKKNTSKRQYARGRGFGQAEAEGAKEVLSQTVPDSGTPMRGLMAVGLGGYLNPYLGAGIAGGYGLYTRPGMKAAQAAIASRPQSAAYLRELLEQSAPYAGLIGTGAGLNAK